MKRVAMLFALLPLLLAAPAADAGEHHVKATLVPVGGSGISGSVQLEQRPHGGTLIGVVARGLTPRHSYVSLYYDSNHTCQLEPYSIPDDEIGGGAYTANAGGVGTTRGVIDDDLDEVLSVSVRRASDFALLACADIHP